jgi:hypothetical protein
MGELKKQFASVLRKKKTTLGRLDANNGTKTDIQQNIYHTTFHPLGTHRASWKRPGSVPFDWDGLYALEKDQGFQVHKNDPSGRTPFEQCWDYEAGPSVDPRSVFSDNVLSHLEEITRSQLECLPTDLSTWNVHNSPPYCAGIGGGY